MTTGMTVMQLLILSTAVVISSIIFGLFLRNFLLAKLIHIARKTKWQFDDIILEGLRSGIVFWSIAVGVYYVLKNVSL
ncbi:MAG: hypothetical protein ACP5US_07195, partial [Candidatus Kryptoniota bacterium]